MALCAQAVAAEAARLIESAVVRDPKGAPRPARPEDMAILFRARAGHQYFEEALEAVGIRTYVYKGLGFFDAPEVQDLQALVRYLAQPESNLRAAELLRSRIVRVSDVALTRLAPSFAAAILSRDVDPSAVGLEPIDAALLARLRDAVPGWLALADRVTPSELVDVILHDTAYGYEMRGRRLDQARENIKKMRGLIRRVENRGYATLGRIAQYFETLGAGEESNAVVQSTGAVNLMTIHAAKGLEFPIVFLVNMHAPGRRGAAVSIIERGPDGEPCVAFGASPETKVEERRETEELRRLMYVAVTRARDRLYFAAEVDDAGAMKRPAHSLAGLLPWSLAAVAGATGSADEITWDSPAGGFAFRVVTPGQPAAVPDIEAPSAALPVARSIVVPPGPVAATVLGRGPDADPRRTAAQRERLTGTLVHRLFERQVNPTAGLPDLEERISDLIRPDEAIDLVDREALAREAGGLFLRLRSRPDVAEVLAGGVCHYEVPFSYRAADRPDQTVRGVLDCLVLAPDGAVTVLELKTGQPRPEHDVQASIYREAAAALFGPGRITVKIVYP